MFRIWAKVMREGKSVRQCVKETEGKNPTWPPFLEYPTETSPEAHVPTPVLLKTHILNFAKFNHVRFYPRDFMEEVDFDYLLLENIVV